MNNKQYFVYIETNKTNTVLYTGVTNSLIKRSWQHKNGLGSVFTKKYKVNKLVYYETYEYVKDALTREKQIKAGSRNKKTELIKKMNPNFNDLYDDVIK